MPKYGPGRRESCWILVSFDDPAVAKTNAEMKPVPKRNAKKEGETEKPPPLGVVFCREKGNPWLFAQENGAMCLAESIVGNWKAEKVQVFGRQWNGKEAEVMHTFQKRIWIEMEWKAGRDYDFDGLLAEDDVRQATHDRFLKYARVGGRECWWKMQWTEQACTLRRWRRRI